MWTTTERIGRAAATGGIALAAVLLAATGCGAGRAAAPGGQRTPAGTNSAGPAASHTAATRPAATTPGPTRSPKASPTRHRHRARFAWHVSHVHRAQVRHSWHPGCPVPLRGLRRLTVTYHGFDHHPHTGVLVVNASAAKKLAIVFKRLYRLHYPIRRMVPVERYHGSDFKSIDADNTSAFNCRDATGSSSWSEHAYGLAVDLNPCENPYVYADGHEEHKHCRKYVDRTRHDPGLIHAGDPVVRAFAAVGWGWGGIWHGDRDYQHFSANSR